MLIKQSMQCCKRLSKNLHSTEFLIQDRALGGTRKFDPKRKSTFEGPDAASCPNSDMAYLKIGSAPHASHIGLEPHASQHLPQGPPTPALIRPALHIRPLRAKPAY